MDLIDYKHGLTEDFWYFKLKEDLIRRVIPKNFKKIIFVGSGVIKIPSYLRNKEITLLDKNKNTLNLCKRINNNKKIKLIHKKIEQVSNMNQKFDVVIITDVLEHIKKPRRAISSMKNILKKNGLLIVYVPANQKLFTDRDKQFGHYRRYTKQRMISEFADLKIKYLGYHLFFLYPFIYLSKRIIKKSNIKPLFHKSKILNFLVYKVLQIENICIQKKLKLPIGSQLLLIAQKTTTKP
ncbi:MAG: methyltransferase domain-containing protein [bacterium]|nr:class I SAM-dependent methyltransferase [Nanoarchaeota archaeon]